MTTPPPPAAAFDGAMSFLASRAEALRSTPSGELAARVRSIAQEHDSWRAACLNLTPAENTISKMARRLLDTDLATRVTEGLPGAKEYPGEPQNRFIDELEAVLAALASEMFGAAFVDWRPVSTSMANAIVFSALLSPGDKILAQSTPAGGNYSYQAGGFPAVARLEVAPVPPRGDCFELDLDACRDLARRDRPRMIVIGGSYSLFPLPVAELAAIAREVDAFLLMDAAHTALLMATGEWPNALTEGADILTLSTHKVMSGPVGGMILTNDRGVAEAVLGLTFPVFMQTRDQNKYASAAHAFSEMREFGAAYARQMISNARALGMALAGRGFKPLGAGRQFTASHQLVVDLSPLGARALARAWREAGILVSAEHLSSDEPGSPTGVRLTVQEVTRRGMREAEMGAIAELMAAIAFENAPGETVSSRVADLTRGFPSITFSFDEPAAAQPLR